jgi:hypothetical protein
LFPALYFPIPFRPDIVREFWAAGHDHDHPADHGRAVGVYMMFPAQHTGFGRRQILRALFRGVEHTQNLMVEVTWARAAGGGGFGPG